VAEERQSPAIVTSDVARVISSSTKSAPVWSPRTPRWILEFLRTRAVTPVAGGIYQLNKVVDDDNGTQIHNAPLLHVPSATLKASHSHPDNARVETTAGLYDTAPREIALQPVQSVVKIPNRVPALYSNDHDQLQTQLNVASEFMAETTENLVFNHPDFGLVQNVAQRMQFEADGPPTPDVLDDLLSLAWRRPDLFVMHPLVLAEFRKRATAQSLSLEEIEIFGVPFTAWRGLPIVPSNKLHFTGKAAAGGDKESGKKRERASHPKLQVQGGTSSILLMRLGEAKQGVVYLSAKGEEACVRLPSITVEFMGLGDNAVASYLLTAYTGVAVLSTGALARADVRL
jgi:hypothetical protein